MTTSKKPLARWTIGAVNNAGFDCLLRSIDSFLHFYDVEPVVCFNCEEPPLLKVPLYDQRIHRQATLQPRGVAWKLYPPRLAQDRHEILIDNDIIFRDRIPEIDHFFESDCTLLLEGSSRNYGVFEKHVPPPYRINSGIYGMPPGFDFEKYFRFFARKWEENANKASVTFDEQGLVALALLNSPRFAIIPENVVTNCEYLLVLGKALHFVSLNRVQYHSPYRLFVSLQQKLNL